jgi:signal transduction histidine kinase
MDADGFESSAGAAVVIDPPHKAGVGLATVGIGLAGLGLGVLELTIGIPGADPPDHLLLISVLVGWAFVGSSLLALARYPDNSVGRLLAAVGLLWFVPLLTLFDSSIAFSLALVGEGLFWAPLAQLFMSFPSGRLENRFDRGIVVSLYVLLPLMNLLTLVFLDFETAGCGGCPANMFLLSDNLAAARSMMTLDSLISAAYAVIVVSRFVLRWRKASGPSRRALQPVMWGIVPGFLAAVYFVVTPVIGISPEQEDRALPLVALALAGLPVGFVVGLFRSRLDRSLVGDLLVELKGGMRHGRLRQALARALGDPLLELAFWLPESERYVDEEGRDVTVTETGLRQATRISDSQGQPLAVLVHDPAVSQDALRVEAAASAARLALENERLHADLRAQLEEVRASRMRVVNAGDEARRRLERDLHDGAQQRLLAISAAIERVRAMDVSAPPYPALLSEIACELKEALVELRDLARGIHPSLLTDEGVGPAVDSLARRAQVPTRIVQTPVERFSAAVEAAAYFVVAEALTNAARHSGASKVTIDIRNEHESLHVCIRDDGKGGATQGGGSGLRGIRDRVLSLGGSLHVDSPLGSGTVVTAIIPTWVDAGQ